MSGAGRPGPRLTVLILTKNERARLPDCLASARGADEIVVVDDESHDGTPALAAAAGARVVTRKMDSFAAQRNFAQDQARGDWVFFLDADERLSSELLAAIRRHLERWPGAAGRVLRRNHAFGRRHRFGVLKPDRVTRLFPKGAATWTGLVHERPIFTGPVRPLAGHLEHLTYADWAQYRAKMERYASLWAETAQAQGRRAGRWTAVWRAGAGFLKMFGLNLGVLGGPTAWLLCWRYAGYNFAKYRRLAALTGRRPPLPQPPV